MVRRIAIAAIAASSVAFAQPLPPPLPPPAAVFIQPAPTWSLADTVRFGDGEFRLDDSARFILDAQARWLLANPAVRARIEGHSDQRTPRDYAIAIGERRATAVRDYLISRGVEPYRLRVVSWGRERPAGAGNDEYAWARNRRVVTILEREPLGSVPLVGA